ncbi:MAG: alpha/beta hydrolase-fold protein [Bacteroidota bacterium]|nr:alpha/beta hydrolase-fold protein [Bacteroidota bacterium]MDP4217069.1 alpha/beta hydrolase-fold protein [Bacteroidota bacterium]MDP4244413.1 alpha/beta hydrolase-fold protein [Bacteroidota bacterium]MDP4254849.1 alpha/beta hydrolase-fold protein [Bacteroidota bacterium]MDP4259792.1 alpha/beta hydrolase-fold protein [Bacteroidota bacterium]
MGPFTKTFAAAAGLAALLSVRQASAQEVYHFTKGLFLSSAGRYGREAIYTDQLAYRLFNHTLERPVANGKFGANGRGEAMTWVEVSADSLLRFRRRGAFGGPGGGGGYYYFTYSSPVVRTALLHVKGDASLFFNGEPHAGDPYDLGWLYIPVRLNKGINELYVRGGQVTADLIFSARPVQINLEDSTMPSVVLTHDNHALQGALVIINASPVEWRGLVLESTTGATAKVRTLLPPIAPMSSRKVAFGFDASGIAAAGRYDCQISLLNKGKVVDERSMPLFAVEPTGKYSETFVSDIDGSLQYYAVTPQIGGPKNNAALFLSVHGAGVEAIGQARAYHSKDWGTLVAATNRRPRGFNWEDWGRIDAMEVLSIAKREFKPDPQHIYLTGHSMGGHGTWYLGATYPDKWAAIGACSGYPTLKGYGSADGLIPDSSRSPMEQILLRASNPSDVLQLAHNYKALGVYILHGDADRVVPVTYARQMRKVLGEFHTDFSYHEVPGAEHWYGDQSVDWPALFDFFKWHALAPDSSMDKLEFITPSPGISSSYRWADIWQQDHPLQYSRINLTRDRHAGTIRGTTENIRVLALRLTDFGAGKKISIRLDSSAAIEYTTHGEEDTVFLKAAVPPGAGAAGIGGGSGGWALCARPALSEKSPLRYGTFKDPFSHRMVFVYGTTGNEEENRWNYMKARFDLETWYYRGNGAADLIADKEYRPDRFEGRNIILYGNANTNSAWGQLLGDCPIQVQRGQVRVGEMTLNGDDLGAYFTWPIARSSQNSVGVVSGSGLKGMNATLANQYFAGGSGFPDFMIFSLDMLSKGAEGLKMAGYFDNDWKLDKGEMISR